ncbi:cytochrome c [Candidatus Pelagibacter sp.]|nr:cytochrome c [Candidatus Pelagibacter sp.]|tara:strand:- start:476 stop:790 length:315 start_codon:yes stop_codon:yes gene_type:complete
MKKSNYFYFYLIVLNIIFTPVYSDEILKKGKSIFLEKGNCAACHSLSDAGSVGQIGPSLNGLKLEKKVVVKVVTHGVEDMPAYKDILSKKEIDAVSIYVSINSN